jgi:hypothetical protein
VSGRERLRLAADGAAMFLVLITLAAGVLALILQLWPHLRPAASIGANAKVFAVEPGVSREDAFNRTSAGKTDADKRMREYLRNVEKGRRRLTELEQQEVKRALGWMVYVQVSVEGWNKKDVFLHWSLYRARSGHRVSERNLQNYQDQVVSLDAPTDRLVRTVWVPRLGKPANVFVRIEIKRKDTILAVADSPRFSEPRH